MSRVWIEGASREELDLERDLMALYLMVANGLEGDVRLVGETPDDVAMLRGLLRGAGGCEAIEAPREPAEAPLYRAGDECYRQHAGARAFLDPRARDGAPPLPIREPVPSPPASPPAAPAPAVGPAPPRRREPIEELDALYARLRAAERAAGDLQDRIDRGHAADADAASAQLAAHDREAADALADLTRLIARLGRRSPDVVDRWAAGHGDPRFARAR